MRNGANQGGANVRAIVGEMLANPYAALTSLTSLQAEKDQLDASVVKMRQRPLWDMLLKFECDVARSR